MNRFFLFLPALALCGMAACTGRVQAQVQEKNQEYAKKSVYFGYFGEMTAWPAAQWANTKGQFVIGVVGDNPFRKFLVQNGGQFSIKAAGVNKNTIQNKKIIVIEYKSADDLKKNYRPCHILFLSAEPAQGVINETPQDRVKAAVTKTKGQNVLLFSEAATQAKSKELAQAGVMVSYWNDMVQGPGGRKGIKIKMFINQKAAKANGLKISANLLTLTIVQLL